LVEPEVSEELDTGPYSEPVDPVNFTRHWLKI